MNALTYTLFGMKKRAPKYMPERSYARLTTADALRLLRELQELSQSELARRAGIAQATISAIEKGRVQLGVERARKLGRALGVHPAVLLFPELKAAPKRSRAA